MFFYLSFLRPPPSYSSTEPGRRISIIPQITNDLRTEFYHDAIDIYLAWVKCDPSGGLGALSQPSKLTTWRGSDAYKEVLVVPPKGIQSGQTWQMLLCVKRLDSNAFSTTVDFSESGQTFGSGPLPVLSLPIKFGIGNCGRSTDDKQRNIERLLRFPSIRSSSSELAEEVKVGPLRILEHLTFDLDKKVWDSGIGLSKWLVDQFSQTKMPTFLSALIEGNMSKRVLELGAGTGLVSIVLAALLRVALRHPGNDSEAEVTIYTSDLPSATDVIQKNVDLNVGWMPSSMHPHPLVLDWESDTLPAEISGGIDLVVMADVTYNTASFPALVGTLKKLSMSCPDDRSEGSRTPQVLLAYKERHPDERTLWSMAKGIGLEFEEIGRIAGAAGAPIEIYLGKYTPGR